MKITSIRRLCRATTLLPLFAPPGTGAALRSSRGDLLVNSHRTRTFPPGRNPLRLLLAGGLGLTLAHAAPNAAPAAPMDRLQKAVLDELNVARTKPLQYVEYLKDHRRRFQGNLFKGPSGMRIMTREGVGAVDEAIAALTQQPPLTALTFSQGLALAARDHAEDIGPKGLTGHAGSDGSNPAARVTRYGKPTTVSGECISFGPADARQIVMQLIIDDGVAGRGHRHSIYTAEFQLAGIASGPHKTLRCMCVIDFADGYKEEPQAIAKRK